MSTLDISVVIPVFRSSDGLVKLSHDLIKVLEQGDFSFEIIFVEDCGGDDSWSVIKMVAEQDSRVRGIKFSRNFGQHAATICGISHAAGELIVTLDDDQEHPPEAIPELIAKAKEGYALVYGVFSQRSHAGWRNQTSHFVRKVFDVAIPSLNYDYTSFRVIDARIAKALHEFDSPFPFVDGYLSWLTNNYATVEVAHGVRISGKSNYTLRKLLAHTGNIFVTFSDLPLKLASWIGLLFFLIGMGWFGIIIAGKLFGIITVSGYASIMATIILFGGIQLLILGIFGEYLGRMNFKSSRKPLYLVAKTTEKEM